MKWSRHIWTAGFVLAGLLAVAAALLTSGSRDLQTNPTTVSFSASGTAAFRELLSRQGFSVQATTSTQPSLRKQDTLVAFVYRERLERVLDPTASAGEEGPIRRGGGEEAAFAAVRKHLENGGSVLVLPVTRDFRETGKSESFAVRRFDGSATVRLESPLNAPRGAADAVFVAGMARLPLYSYNRDDWVTAGRYKSGRIAVLTDGIIATNRYLDREDNARLLVEVTRALTGAGGRVVFAEATFGNARDPGLLETVGPWAIAGWRQILVLGLVVVFTLGVRFGLAEDERRRQAGQRELLEALGDTFRRAKLRRSTLSLLADDYDRRLRKHLKLASGMSKPDRDARLAPPVAQALRAAEAAATREDEPKQAEALAICQNLETAVREAYPSFDTRPGRRKKQ